MEKALWAVKEGAVEKGDQEDEASDCAEESVGALEDSLYD